MPKSKIRKKTKNTLQKKRREENAFYKYLHKERQKKVQESVSDTQRDIKKLTNWQHHQWVKDGKNVLKLKDFLTLCKNSH